MSALIPMLKMKRKDTMNNPLAHPSVLHRILGFMEYKELISLRLVCKRWDEKCCIHLQNQSTIIFKSWNDVENFSNVYFHTKEQLVKPFNSLKLERSFPSMERDLIEGFGKIGPLIESLTIACNFNAEEWIVILFQVFINLRVLNITGCIPYEVLFKQEKTLPPNDLSNLLSVTFNVKNKRSEQLFIRKFTKDLFSVTPNLTLVKWNKTEGNNTETLSRAMFQCLTNSKISKLTKFCCPSLTCGIRELNELSLAKFPLKRLEISLGIDITSHFLGDFLANYAGTLKVLYLGFGSANAITIKTSDNEKLGNIEEITLEDYKRSIGFIISMKGLKKLVLLNSNVDRAFYVDWDEQHLSELPKLRSFEIYSDPCRKAHKFPMTAVVRLAYYFPKLKVLRLQSLDDKCLRRVFRNFPYLIELRVSGNFSDDAFKALSAAAKFISEGCARSSTSRFMLYSYNLANVTNLRHLELDSICITDDFILEGIIKWKALRELSLSNCRIRYSTLTRVLMEMDLHSLKLEFCEIIPHLLLNEPFTDYQESDFPNKEIIFMSYGDIKKWRRAVLGLFLHA